jgi:hypothetical protein
LWNKGTPAPFEDRPIKKHFIVSEGISFFPTAFAITFLD